MFFCHSSYCTMCTIHPYHSFSFLHHPYVLTHESDGNIITSVYKKTPHTDRYLDFSSRHPVQHKVSVIRTLFHRASTLSSSLIQRTKEEVHIKTALKKNGYPHHMICKYCVQGDSIQRQSLSTHEDQPVATITLPYIQGISEALHRILLNLDIRVAFRPHSTLCQLLVRPKDPIP